MRNLKTETHYWDTHLPHIRWPKDSTQWTTDELADLYDYNLTRLNGNADQWNDFDKKWDAMMAHRDDWLATWSPYRSHAIPDEVLAELPTGWLAQRTCYEYPLLALLSHRFHQTLMATINDNTDRRGAKRKLTLHRHKVNPRLPTLQGEPVLDSFRQNIRAKKYPVEGTYMILPGLSVTLHREGAVIRAGAGLDAAIPYTSDNFLRLAKLIRYYERIVYHLFVREACHAVKIDLDRDYGDPVEYALRVSFATNKPIECLTETGDIRKMVPLSTRYTDHPARHVVAQAALARLRAGYEDHHHLLKNLFQLENDWLFRSVRPDRPEILAVNEVNADWITATRNGEPAPITEAGPDVRYQVWEDDLTGPRQTVSFRNRNTAIEYEACNRPTPPLGRLSLAVGGKPLASCGASSSR